MDATTNPTTTHRSLAVVALGCMAVAVTVLLAIYFQQRDAQQAPQANLPQQPTPTPTLQYIQPQQATALTMDTVYQQVDLDQTFDPDMLWTMVVTGDIIPARGVDYQMRSRGLEYPFGQPDIVKLLQSGDLTISSLEAPIINNCPVHMSGFTFCGQSGFASAMAKVGIDIISLENNHIGNYGAEGIAETKQHLSQAGIQFSTANQLTTVKVNGKTIGMLAFNGITGWPILSQNAEQKVKDAKDQVDLLLVAAHWGKEYQLLPTTDPGIAPEDPLVVSRALIDAGADMIIGNHPHWVQGVEFYKGKLIAYAYGNFIFDQSWSLDTLHSVIGRYTFYDTVLVKAEYFPTQIADQVQPYLLQGTEKQYVLDRMKQSSQLIQQERQRRGQ